MDTSDKITCGKIYREWKMCNKPTRLKTTKFLCVNPSFYFLNSTWHLYVSICNFNGTYSKLEIGLSADTDDLNIINFTVGIKDSEPAIKFGPQKEAFGRHQDFYMESSSMDGPLNLFNKHMLLLTKYLKENTPTVYFEASSAESLASTGKDMGSQCSPLNDTAALSHDLQGLLLSENDSDVTIEVQGEIFKAHRVILKSRSSVFAAMFEHDMKEKNIGEVKIDDCDPNIFRNFLQCIYTGRVDNLLPNNVTSLYRLADNYNLMGIKEQCVNLMEEQLSVDTVCDVIILADIHNNIELKNSAIEFMAANMEKILNTSKWVPFMADNSVLAAAILKRVFKKVTS